MPHIFRNEFSSPLVDVFISYSRSTRPIVEPIKRKLDALGLDCFFDMHQIDGGSNFPDIIDRALRESKAVLCCWSPEYFTGQWSMIECRDAVARGNIVPVAVKRFEQFTPPADLRQINWFDLVDWMGEDDHEDWRRTLQNLGKYVGRELVAPLNASGLHVSGKTGEPGHVDSMQDLRVTWSGFAAKSHIGAVERFLKRVRIAAPGSGFEFEIEHHLEELRCNAERRSKARERAEAERRVQEAADEAVRREAENTRSRLGSVWREVIAGMPEDTIPEMVTVCTGDDAPGDSGEDMAIAYAYALGRYPVSFAEIDAAIAFGADIDWPSDLGGGRGHNPATNISWHNAASYVVWLNARLGLTGRKDAYRLPSEAEWVYACGTRACRLAGGETGERDGVCGQQIVLQEVQEWCADIWDAESGPNLSAPGRPANGGARVVRCGSQQAASPAGNADARFGLDPEKRSDKIGFRLARSFLQ